MVSPLDDTGKLFLAFFEEEWTADGLLSGAGVLLEVLGEIPFGIGSLFGVLKCFVEFVEKIQDSREDAARLSFWAKNLIRIIAKFLPQPFPANTTWDETQKEAVQKACKGIEELQKCIEKVKATKDSWCDYFRGREYKKQMEIAQKDVEAAMDVIWKYFEAETNSEVKKTSDDKKKVLPMVTDMSMSLSAMNESIRTEFASLRENTTQIIRLQKENSEHLEKQTAQIVELTNVVQLLREKMDQKVGTMSSGDEAEIAHQNAKSFWEQNFKGRAKVSLKTFIGALHDWLGVDVCNSSTPALIQTMEKADSNKDGMITQQEFHVCTYDLTDEAFPARSLTSSKTKSTADVSEEDKIKQFLHDEQRFRPSDIDDVEIRECWVKSQLNGQKNELQTKLPWHNIKLTLYQMYTPPLTGGDGSGEIMDRECEALKRIVESAIRKMRQGNKELRDNTKISWQELKQLSFDNGGSLKALMGKAIEQAKSIKKRHPKKKKTSKSDATPSAPVLSPKDRNAERFVDHFRMQFDVDNTVVFNPRLEADSAPPQELYEYLRSHELKIGTLMAKDPLSPESPYFEVKLGPSDAVQRHYAVAVGLTTHCHDSQYMPGWSSDSIALHSDDGVVYTGQMLSDSLKISNIVEGDTVGCGILFSTKGDAVTVYWTRNGQIQGFAQAITDSVYPYIGVQTNKAATYAKIDAKFQLAHPATSSSCSVFQKAAVASVVSIAGLERKRSFCQSINQALEVATAGDEIHLAEGIHCLDSRLVVAKNISLIGKRDADGLVKSKIFVYYSATEEEFSDNSGPALVVCTTGKCRIKDISICCFGGDIKKVGILEGLAVFFKHQALCK